MYSTTNTSPYADGAIVLHGSSFIQWSIPYIQHKFPFPDQQCVISACNEHFLIDGEYRLNQVFNPAEAPLIKNDIGTTRSLDR